MDFICRTNIFSLQKNQRKWIWKILSKILLSLHRGRFGFWSKWFVFFFHLPYLQKMKDFAVEKNRSTQDWCLFEMWFWGASNHFFFAEIISNLIKIGCLSRLSLIGVEKRIPTISSSSEKNRMPTGLIASSCIGTAFSARLQLNSFHYSALC